MTPDSRKRNTAIKWSKTIFFLFLSHAKLDEARMNWKLNVKCSKYVWDTREKMTSTFILSLCFFFHVFCQSVFRSIIVFLIYRRLFGLFISVSALGLHQRRGRHSQTTLLFIHFFRNDYYFYYFLWIPTDGSELRSIQITEQNNLCILNEMVRAVGSIAKFYIRSTISNSNAQMYSKSIEK